MRRLAVRPTLVGLAAASAVLMAAQPALAASTWQPQQPPIPTGALGSGFEDVSCTSATACMAVGNYLISGGTSETVAESWNGSSWTILSTPNPSASHLSRVSCTAASACTAVGNVISGGVQLPLAERWNGTAWTVQTTPTHAGASSSGLLGVSCSASNSCEAVGFYENTSGTGFTLAEHWNGTKWASQHTPSHAGAFTSLLYSVSCTSGTTCTAIGNFTSAHSGAMGETLNGSTWTLQTVPNPSGGSDGFLSGVSCTAANACTAVGNYFTNSTNVTLAERWNGTAWAVQTTPQRTGSTGSGFASVSCTGAKSCTAVGYAQKTGDNTLAQHWNGTTWTLQAPGAPAGAQTSMLSGVSCTSASACMAAGDYTNSSGNELLLTDQYS